MQAQLHLEIFGEKLTMILMKDRACMCEHTYSESCSKEDELIGRTPPPMCFKLVSIQVESSEHHKGSIIINTDLSDL